MARPSSIPTTLRLRYPLLIQRVVLLLRKRRSAYVGGVLFPTSIRLRVRRGTRRTLVLLALSLCSLTFVSPAGATPNAVNMATVNTVNAIIGDESWTDASAPSNGSEVERIRAHLHHVIRRLAHDGTPRRTHLLKALRTYANAGVFPQRTADRYAGRRPRFRDDRGVWCAVGQLIVASGEGALARELAAAYEYAYLMDIDDPRVDAWAKQHGFLRRELAMIQPSYGPLPFRRTVSVETYGGFAPAVVGLSGGVRFGFTLARPGWFGPAMENAQDQDVLRLMVGVELLRGRRWDLDGRSPYGRALSVPIALAWESYGSSPFSWMVELGANLYFHPGVLAGNETRFVDNWVHWIVASVGAQWRFTPNFSAIARVGLPTSSLGLRYEFGNTSHRPGP